ncbi:11526_t:CDS:2, partial [Acaulospora morrowiae]
MENESRPNSSSSSGDFSSRNTSSSKSSVTDDVYGLCKECGSPKTSAEWCRKCNSERFRNSFHSWTSGNKDIDNVISTTQLTAIGCSQVLEWIPWKRFLNIRQAGLGRFGTAYTVTWLDGYITHWNNDKKTWGRCDSGKKFIVKVLQNSSNNFSNFLNELLAHKNGRNGLIRCYGITQHPTTLDYALVIRCVEEDLKIHLYKNQPFPEYDWKTKLEIIADIALVLHRIHESGSVHGCLHTGNIKRQMNSTLITELNMVDDSPTLSHSNGVYGVLPYIAPEILRGGTFTKAADVYSLGVMMWEVATQRPPFDLCAHDKMLAQRICCGLRPHISNKIPKSLAKLIKRCWDAIPENRPESEEIYIWVQWWLDLVCSGTPSDIAVEFCIDNEEKKEMNGITWIHPEAIYYKRYLDFSSLPEPENFSPDTYHHMVSFCARIHHSDNLDCHVEPDVKDINDIMSLFTRRPSVYIEEGITVTNHVLTPTNHCSKEDPLTEFKMPGAYNGNNGEVLASWQ